MSGPIIDPQPVHAECPDCGHRWIICYLPMEMERAARTMQRATCPYGCDGRPLFARAPASPDDPPLTAPPPPL